jgi:cephalosporin-C deacetylase
MNKPLERQTRDPYRTAVKRPDDFDAFWEHLLEQAARIPLNATVEPIPLRSTPQVEVSLVHYDSLGGVRIAGWYCLPRDRSGKLPAIAYMPGYIGEPDIPRENTRGGYATFGAITRGKLRSNGQFNPGFPGLLTHNIVDRNTYSYRGLYIDASRVIDFLLSRDEIDPRRIGVTGGSQGGGLTISTAALRPEVRAAVAAAPFPCGFMDAMELAHTYPYQEIRDYLRLYPERRAAVTETLAYFDGINFAPRVRCPIMIHYGLQDNICPAETVSAACDAIGSQDKHIYPYDGQGHDAGRAHHGVIVDEFFQNHLKP